MNMGDKIYYTGDMANDSGWFAVSSFESGRIDLVEIDGTRKMPGVQVSHIGHEFHGCCGTRLVTEAAYRNYHDRVYAAMLPTGVTYLPTEEGGHNSREANEAFRQSFDETNARWRASMKEV